MDDELKTLLDGFTTSIIAYIQKENTILQAKREKVAMEKKDAVLLDQREKELQEKEDDLQKRELLLQEDVQHNRDKSKTLDAREQRLKDEKERLKHSLINLELEEI